MSAHSKRYALTARRAFLSAIFMMLALLGGLAALGYYAYQRLDVLLGPLLGPASWASVQNIAAALALDFALYAVALVALAVLLAWLLSRWVAGPLNRLVAAITVRETPLPVRAPGEVGQLARRFD